MILISVGVEFDTSDFQRLIELALYDARGGLAVLILR
jgi:hypothetical protein